jgi:hypothetical protein
MIRSVLKLSVNDFQTIKNQLPTRTANHRLVKNNFLISKKVLLQLVLDLKQHISRIYMRVGLTKQQL